VLVLVKAGMFGCARPLPVPPRGWYGGEVVRLLCVMWPRRKEGSWPSLSLALARPRLFGPLLTDVSSGADLPGGLPGLKPPYPGGAIGAPP
jgi:hypothetical protein